MSRFIKIIVNPFFLSFIFSLVIILLLPPIFNKYNLELKLKSKLEREIDFFYDDLDEDGFSEQIDICSNNLGNARLYIRDHNSYTLDQWNFDYDFIQMPNRYFAADVNNDGKKEIFVFTIHQDSIFLNAVDPLGTKTYIFQNRFITKVNVYEDKPDFGISTCDFGDLNGDLYKEIVFSIKAGFTLFPRKIFAYDYHNDSLITSPECGNILSRIQVVDLNNDGIPEIVADTWTPQNYSDPKLNVIYDDMVSYLMIFNNKLEFFFKPYQFTHSIGTISNNTINYQGKNYILSLNLVTGKSKLKSSLNLFDLKGNLLRSELLPEISSLNSGKFGFPIIRDNHILVPTVSGEILFYNFDLKLTSVKKILTNDLVSPRYEFMDINNDGFTEIITFTSDNTILITDKKLKNKVTYNFNTERAIRVSIKYNGDLNPELFAISGRNVWFFTYAFNPLYYWHYPVYLIIYVIILLINLLIQKVQKAQLQSKYQTQQQITELQLKTIRNQMEPHFTFNAINSIASMVYEGSRDEAYNYFSKLSQLIRATLINADRITRSLKEEISFITDYLEIEKLRFGDKFVYQLEIDDNINLHQQIPKMMLQTYCENAVKHGLMHKETGGILKIIINRRNNYLIFTILDNGIGRKRAKEIGSRSTGKGQAIMKQYYELYNKSKKKKIEHEIIDLYDDNQQAIGTKIIVMLPIDSDNIRS